MDPGTLPPCEKKKSNFVVVRRDLRGMGYPSAMTTVSGPPTVLTIQLLATSSIDFR
jgi:hypothetical protein